MKIEKGLLEAFNDDMPDKILAMLLSSTCKDVTWTVQTEEQLTEIYNLFENVANAFFYYLYDYEDNYLEQEEIEESEELICDTDYALLSEKALASENFTIGADSWTLSSSKETDGYKFTLSLDDEDKFKQALKGYFSHFEIDDLINEDENILLKEAHEKNLLDMMTADKYNLSHFHVCDIKYIKPIYCGIVQNTIFLHDSKIELSNDFEVVSFKCTIDGTDFVESQKKEKIKKQQANKKPRTRFSPSVQDLYDYIKRYAPAKNYEIYKEDLVGEDRRNKLYAGMGMLTTMVNRLNKEYKEISNTDTTLMKYDKFLDCYLIENIWGN
ncbi:MAG: hypothetical protein NC200_07145 [Candidatus Gastranaerophilales bacterium]|nr:hypothetical protein [Candidatus Gastranaerophilales bacterium]